MVCHFTSVHPFDDVRIFQKECRTLAAAGFDVHLVAVGAPPATMEGVTLHPVTKTWNSRLGRMSRSSWQVAKLLRAIDADVYHFHDPEMIPVGLWLRAKGKRVIYDAHEDLPRDLYSKKYLRWFRYLLPWPIEAVENAASRRFSAIVSATPFIGQRFTKINPRTIVVNNYPLRDQFTTAEQIPWSERGCNVAYIGVISAHRGLFQMVRAMELVNQNRDATLLLAGRFATAESQREAKALPGWKYVRELGHLGRRGVADVLGQSRAGLVVFQPEPNHVNSQPNKLFEYMSAGIPVIGSNFPLWTALFGETGSGMAVDPKSPEELAQAIEFVLANPQDAEAMGRRGREAVVKWCNWEHEAHKLLELYRSLTELATEPEAINDNVI